MVALRMSAQDAYRPPQSKKWTGCKRGLANVIYLGADEALLHNLVRVTDGRTENHEYGRMVRF